MSGAGRAPLCRPDGSPVISRIGSATNLTVSDALPRNWATALSHQRKANWCVVLSNFAQQTTEETSISLSSVQRGGRHECCSAYSRRKGRNTNWPQCRFTRYGTPSNRRYPSTPDRTQTPKQDGRVRFLSIRPRLCSTLPSDPASRRRPCASLILRHHQAGGRTFTSKLSIMLGTLKKPRAKRGSVWLFARGSSQPRTSVWSVAFVYFDCWSSKTPAGCKAGHSNGSISSSLPISSNAKFSKPQLRRLC